MKTWTSLWLQLPDLDGFLKGRGSVLCGLEARLQALVTSLLVEVKSPLLGVVELIAVFCFIGDRCT